MKEEFSGGFEKNPDYCDGTVDGTSASDYWIGNHDFSYTSCSSTMPVPIWNGDSVLPTSGLYCDSDGPGSRYGQASLTYPNDDLIFFFGGYGYDSTEYIDYMNDIWSFNTQTEKWAYWKGSTYHYDPWEMDYNHGVSLYSKNRDDSGRYANIYYGRQRAWYTPSGRSGSALVHGLDDDSFFMFGGYGYTNPRTKLLPSNQLWEFDKTTKNWAFWYGIQSPEALWDGSFTVGVSSYWIVDYGMDYCLRLIEGMSIGETIAQRSQMVVWEPSESNLKYIFGGFIDESRGWNDLWRMDLSVLVENNDNNPFTLVTPPITGTYSLPCQDEDYSHMNVFHADNLPSPRAGAYYWNYRYGEETYDRMYLFGGFDNCRGEFLNDIWRFDSQLAQWMPIKVGSTEGDHHQALATYGLSDGIYSDIANPGSRAYGDVFVVPHEFNSSYTDYYYVFFGGLGMATDGPGFLNDLWVFSDTLGQFSSISEISKVNDFGDYGDSAPHPASRYNNKMFSINIDDNFKDADYYLFNGLTYKDYEANAIAEMWDVNFDNFTCDSYYIFEPNACNGNGLCVSQDLCSCSYMYEGDLCEILKRKCGSYYYDQTGVCNRKGSCVADENCTCDSKFYGQYCVEQVPTSGIVEFSVEGELLYSFGNGTINETIGMINVTYDRITVDVEIPLNLGGITPYEFSDITVHNSTFDCCQFLGDCERTGDVLDSEIEETADGDYILRGAICYFAQEGDLAVSTDVVDKFYVVLGKNHKLKYGDTELSLIVRSSVFFPNETVTFETEGWSLKVVTERDFMKEFLTGAAPVFGGLLILFLCFCCLCCCICIFVAWGAWRVKKQLDKIRKLRHLDLIRKERELEIGAFDSFEISDEIFNISEEDLKITKVISSSGATAIVYLAKYKGKNVAFKAFKTRDFSTQSHCDDFEKEVKMLATLKHDNLLYYYGSMRKSPRVGVVIEYAEKGDLRNFLTGMSFPEGKTTSLTNRFRFIKEIANVMQFLNSMNIIHRDLKCDNILLTGELKCKLIDFGLSRVVEGATSVYLTKQAGTSQYMAPEVTLSSRYGEKCDVFSLGVIMYEIITGDFFPYGERPEFNVELKVALNPDFRPPIREKAVSLVKHMRWYLEMMELCWGVDVDARPSFDLIESEIKAHEEECIAEMGKMEEFMWEEDSFRNYVENHMSKEDLLGEGEDRKENKKVMEEKADDITDTEFKDLLDDVLNFDV